MSTPTMVAEFMAWVKDNYGDSVRSALENEIAKSPCGESRARLYAKLCEVLGAQRIPGIRQAVDVGQIEYDS